VNLSDAFELRQADRDVPVIEVETPGEVTDGARRVLGEKADDARLVVPPSTSGGCAPGTRAPRRRSPH
jgi:hypothetical protein